MSTDQTNSDNSKKENRFEEDAKHRYRMRNDWDNLIEDLIQDGRELGMFDNLPGRGKPLNLKKQVYGADMELAHGLLKDNDLAPAWIMNRRGILQQVDELRQDIQRRWTRHAQEFEIITDPRHRDGLTISWDDACLAWEQRIVKLNKQITDYNLKRPIDNMEILKLSLESELKRANAPRYLR